MIDIVIVQSCIVPNTKTPPTITQLGLTESLLCVQCTSFFFFFLFIWCGGLLIDYLTCSHCLLTGNVFKQKMGFMGLLIDGWVQTERMGLRSSCRDACAHVCAHHKAFIIRPIANNSKLGLWSLRDNVFLSPPDLSQHQGLNVFYWNKYLLK